MDAKKLVLLPIFIMLFSNGYGMHVFIKYIIEKDSTLHLKHSVTEYMLDIVQNNWDNIDLNSKKNIPSVKKTILDKPNGEIVLIKYTFDRSGVFFVTDIFGHEILLDKSMNGDTIELDLKFTKSLKINNDGRKNEYLNDSITATKFYVIKYPAKYHYMGFFDSLAYIHGDLRGGGGGYSFKELDQNLPQYLKTVNRVYIDRINFYKKFVSKYKMPDRLKFYTVKEIQYAYYNDLLAPLMEWDAKLYNDYPIAIRDTLENIGNDLDNDELFENTSYYRSVVVLYNYLDVKNSLTSLREKPDSEHLINRANYAKKEVKGKTQGYYLAWLMQIAGTNNLKETFNQIYKNYKASASEVGITANVSKLNAIINGSGNLSPKEVLELVLEDKTHRALKFSEITDKDFILIDCWATWCIPCRQQIPALNSMAKQYVDRVQFVSLSADQIISKWDVWLKKLPASDTLILQLHAPGAFEHYLFKKLQITSIPRYILINREGKILNNAMPFPSETEKFKNEIDKYLNTTVNK